MIAVRIETRTYPLCQICKMCTLLINVSHEKKKIYKRRLKENVMSNLEQIDINAFRIPASAKYVTEHLIMCSVTVLSVQYNLSVLSLCSNNFLASFVSN